MKGWPPICNNNKCQILECNSQIPLLICCRILNFVWKMLISFVWFLWASTPCICLHEWVPLLLHGEHLFNSVFDWEFGILTVKCSKWCSNSKQALVGMSRLFVDNYFNFDQIDYKQVSTNVLSSWKSPTLTWIKLN